MREFVKEQFNNHFNSYKQMIEYLNNDISIHNNNLEMTIKNLLLKRKEKADTFSQIIKKLKIPMVPSKHAPNIKPIPLKKINNPVVRINNSINNDPYISDSDYENINNIIWTCGTTMEKTARSYYVNTEEELRDHLLAALNTHYYNATGETFRKIGKTDINIEFDNHAAFIGECKIWSGDAYFIDSIQQIINYSTWRDAKVSIILFNKKNKDFPKLLDKISTLIKNIAYNHKQIEKNLWYCDYDIKEKNQKIKICISVYDLYVDKNQFSDKRINKN